jgi:hypothetical protein
MGAAGILLLSVGAAILYGIVQDQVTVRVCVDYFTVGHPPVFDTTSPTFLALGRGVIATWWMGLILGVPLVVAARAGSRPKLSARHLIGPVAIVLGGTAAASLAAGLAGWFFAKMGWVRLVPDPARLVPEERHHRFIANLWAHWAAYGSGTVGALTLCVRTWKRRGRMAREG